MTHDWEALRKTARDEPSPMSVAGMTPWVCEYRQADGETYAIVLHGADPEQVWHDNFDALPNLRILGVSHGFIDMKGGAE